MNTFRATLLMNHSIIGHELERLHEYAAAIESLVAAEADRETFSLEDSARYLSPEEQGEFWAENADYLQALTDGFLYQHRLSLISTIYAVFESHLTHLCRMLCHQKSLRYSLRDLSGNSNLDKAKRFMGKFQAVSLDPQQWDRMERFSSLRNIASHQNGQLNEETSGWLPKISIAFPNVIESDSIAIKPKYEASFVLIDAVRLFYDSLYKALEDWGEAQRVAP
jgi:hypothetical protein